MLPWAALALLGCSRAGEAGPPSSSGTPAGAGGLPAAASGGSAEGGTSGAGSGGDPSMVPLGTSGTGGASGAAGSGMAGSSGTSGASGGAGAAGTGGTAGSAPSAECGGERARGHLQLEALDRGLVAVRTAGGNYVGWRMLGYEYDPEHGDAIAYDLYRDGSRIATVEDSTNYDDQGANADARYSVSAVIDGHECARSAEVTPWASAYLAIPLEPPPGGTEGGATYSYTSAVDRNTNGSVNDASPGDVDGDGRYELIVKWDPSTSKDNSQSGYTGPVYIDAYTLEGERLWRMNLGRNVRAGAHYTQFVVYDFDGDGRAEVALRTAPGTRDGTGEYLSQGPAASDDDDADYRNGDGYVLSGPEYLTVFEGATGKELASVPFEVARGNVDDWGDDYGNRVDRFLASAGFVSDQGGSGEGSGRPAILMARGYYTRATVTAWSFRDGALEKLWTADSQSAGGSALRGQGAHSMAVADVDGDGAQEIIYGAAMIQSDGSFGCATGLGHGDALHVGDLIPSRMGLEVFMPHEDETQRIWDVRDAATCEIIQQSGATGSDNGRGVADDILASNPGAEMWSAADGDLRSCASAASLGGKPSPTNFLIYWDGDELRELLDHVAIEKADGTRLLTCAGCMSNNNTKSTPALTADLFGDWREEAVWRTPDSSELRIYTTTDVTARRIYTLMHDPQYRMQITSEQTAYNQPPHAGFQIGPDMPAPPAPDMHVR